MSSLFSIIETTKLEWFDGLPFSNQFNDRYFSKEGGYAEKKQVFIEGNHLPERWLKMSKAPLDCFNIGEIGFGMGLNFLITWQLWRQIAPEKTKLFFYSCEKFPLTREDLSKCLSLWPLLSAEAQALITQYPVLTPGFHHLIFDQGRVNLILMLGDAKTCLKELLITGDKHLEPQLRNQFIDAWYLDGFSPSKNACLWSEELFEIIALLSQKGTTLATYSVAGLVKNGLQAAGFEVNKCPGYGNKRHRIEAYFNASYKTKTNCLTPWHYALPKSAQKKIALILGAGLAGCFCAYALAKKGWKVTILDACLGPGQGASGNEQAVLYPKLSAYRSPLTDFMLTAFLYAQRFYKKEIVTAVECGFEGILQLAFDKKEMKAQTSMKDWLSAYPDLGQLLEAEYLSSLAGIPIKTQGLFIPLSGWINSKDLCAYLIQQEGITWIPNTPVESIQFDGNQWHAGGYQAEFLVLANGYQANQFQQTAYLPIKPIRGQVTWLKAQSASLNLKIPVCGEGHILPVRNGSHTFGATYHLNVADDSGLRKDDLLNLEKLKTLLPDLHFEEAAICHHWAGVRAATPDYLPLVGAVAIEDLFMEQFARLASNARRYINQPAQTYPGLYVCAGFGSRGLTTIPFCAEWLAALINKESTSMTRAMAQSLSPSRFLYRKIIRSQNEK